MSHTERTKEAIDTWDSPPMRQMRVEELRYLADKAGLKVALGVVPNIHLETMNYDKYMMTVEVLAKIVQLKRIADYQEMQCPV